MNAQILEILALLRREVWEKRRLFAVIYFVTSMLFLAIGWYWPKNYSSSSTILVDEDNILRPLLEGTAALQTPSDQARLAREIIFSRKAMEKVLIETGWFEVGTPDLRKEQIIADVKKNIDVENAGRNLIKISFTDTDSERAFLTVKEITDDFIANSIQAKQSRSLDAYDFINRQALEYQRKLQAAEEALKNFYSQSLDARPGSQEEVNARIMSLRGRMEATQLEIRELNIRKETLRKQLSGEAAITENLTREGQYREQLNTLQETLNNLRLSYLDDYPDIVQVKTQIATIEKKIEEERKMAESNVAGENNRVTQAATTSSLYQELRSQFSAAETEIASLQARLEETKSLLVTEEDRIVRINDVEAKLAELTRDQAVNRDLYQSLLRQRENARISMNIDQENQGSTFKIQEPPILQLTPQGIRFAHFLAAGVFFSFMLPLGLIYGITFIDQKVRAESVITERLGLPVLASVYHMNTPREYTLNSFKKSVILLVIVTSFVAYGYAAWLRVTGVV